MPYQGYIELKYGNFDWGGICDDHFDINDADVICRWVGYPSGAFKAWNSFLYRHDFGHGSGRLLIDNLKCTGNEATILGTIHKLL